MRRASAAWRHDQKLRLRWRIALLPAVQLRRQHAASQRVLKRACAHDRWVCGARQCARPRSQQGWPLGPLLARNAQRSGAGACSLSQGQVGCASARWWHHMAERCEKECSGRLHRTSWISRRSPRSGAYGSCGRQLGSRCSCSVSGGAGRERLGKQGRVQQRGRISSSAKLHCGKARASLFEAGGVRLGQPTRRASSLGARRQAWEHQR